MGLAITALFGFVSGILSYGLFVPSDLKPFNLVGVAGSMSGYALGTQAKNLPGFARAILIVISAVATVACIVAYVIYVQRGTGELVDVILLAVLLFGAFFSLTFLMPLAGVSIEKNWKV
ncbi:MULTISPECIES: hypothetical protein [Bradyrhizobium]|uniref:hypothetical protein n=1 Tax=Bradyrhizobium TaxID=374 RepID=UPI000576A090|nr:MULTISPECIES: hypothetical protein [Bradyrhizobium]MBR1071284.1 hypothetical protein [Bradyrhizobium liaoningense]